MRGPARLPMQSRQFRWHTPYLSLLLLLLNVLIDAAVASIVRKRVEIGIGLCERHIPRRAAAILAGTAGVLPGLGAIVGGVASERTWLTGAGCALAIAAVAWGIVRARMPVPLRIAGGKARFGDCSPEFLALLARDPVES